MCVRVLCINISLIFMRKHNEYDFFSPLYSESNNFETDLRSNNIFFRF